MIGEGTSHKSATQIATSFDSVGAQYGSSVNQDMASVSLRTLMFSTAKAVVKLVAETNKQAINKLMSLGISFHPVVVYVRYRLWV